MSYLIALERRLKRRVSKSANSWKYRVCSQFFYLLSVLKRANKNTDHGGFLALRARSPTVTSLAPPSNSYAPLGTDRLKNSPLDALVPVTYTGSAGNINNQMKPFNFFSRQNYYFRGVCRCCILICGSCCSLIRHGKNQKAFFSNANK